MELFASETLYANIVENLPANSNKIIITVSSQSYDGELTLSTNITQTGLKGAVAEFSSGETITVSANSVAIRGIQGKVHSGFQIRRYLSVGNNRHRPKRQQIHLNGKPQSGKNIGSVEGNISH